MAPWAATAPLLSGHRPTRTHRTCRRCSGPRGPCNTTGGNMQQQTAETDVYYVANLNSSLRQALVPYYGEGFARHKGIYHQLWDALKPDIDTKATGQIWRMPDVMFSQARLLLQYKWGLLWNMKLAKRYRICGPTQNFITGNCPLCHQPDSSGHIMGHCAHPAMRALYIRRHDDAVKTIQRYVAKGALGGYYTIMDAGKATELPDNVSGKRLPRWLVGRDTPDSDKMRPDLLIVKGLPAHHGTDVARGGSSQAVPAKAQCEVHIVEVGYTTDLRYSSKLKEKDEQHEHLSGALTAQGWVVHRHTILLGMGGTMYCSATSALQGLGVSGGRLDKCLRKLLRHTIHAALAIVQCRRATESSLNATVNAAEPAGIG